MPSAHCPVLVPMPEAPMPIALAAFIKASIDWDHARDFDIDLDQIVARFPDITEVDFEHALNNSRR
jgi:hypothetical protein